MPPVHNLIAIICFQRPTKEGKLGGFFSNLMITACWVLFVVLKRLLLIAVCVAGIPEIRVVGDDFSATCRLL